MPLIHKVSISVRDLGLYTYTGRQVLDQRVLTPCGDTIVEEAQIQSDLKRASMLLRG
jgi:hypothetical protein